MGTRWNYWHVYHYMVTTFLHTGTAPVRNELLQEFKELGASEIDEAIAEYEFVVGRDKQ
ncbi:hypothetical protein [Paenibacillus donghaensis]|uniref:hypothetical protein n=1 Tax=Paenibacillus donghaensis TaxID=414771 RepID=UPI0012FE31D1|nr:hypothetical protein [Paenibacillus donghaensis]